jgi:Na+/H+ antiporter NhaD/arsenite permease-like protein
MGGVGGVLSAFMNNVAALALLMPVDIATARKAGRSPGSASCRSASPRSWAVWSR